MRPLLYLICLAGLVTGARADVFNQIDPHKQAEVTGQTVALPTLHFDAVALPSRTLPVAPVSGKTADRSQTIATKTVTLNTLDFPTVACKTLPLANFTAKHATLAQPLIETGITPTDNAKINSRVIRPYTTPGQQELKDQINKIP